MPISSATQLEIEAAYTAALRFVQVASPVFQGYRGVLQDPGVADTIDAAILSNITACNVIAQLDLGAGGGGGGGGGGEGGGGGATLTNIIPTLLDGSHTYGNPTGLSVALVNDRYTAAFTGGDAGDTTWFNADTGRYDAVALTGDGEFIAYNVGIDTGSNPGQFQLCGVGVFVDPLNYGFAVVGNRAGPGHTVECKYTIAGSSYVNDSGANSVPTDKADIRVVRTGGSLTFYYRLVGDVDWILLPHAALAAQLDVGTGVVYVGLVTYGYAYPDPFTASCDQFEVVSGSVA